MKFADIEEIIAAIGRGEMVIMVDDEDRENEGDLIFAAEAADPQKMGFVLRHSSGIICLPIEGERLDQLEVPMMVARNTDIRRTAFTVSIDVAEGRTTGISAADRTRTVLAVLDPDTRPEDLARPGHMYPLRYEPGGVLKRAGHTEAGVDLARLAGMYPAAVLAEVMNDDGTVAILPDLQKFAEEHGLLIGTIADLIAFRRKGEQLVERVVEARMPSAYGTFRVIGYDSVDGHHQVALVMGDLGDGENVLTRVHPECLTGDAFGSLRCDCGQQLDAAMQLVAEEGRGVVLYLRGHEGRGIGLLHKLAAYNLQDDGLDTVDANVYLGFPPDARDYGVGSQILYELGVRSMRLLTNNPTKRAGIEGYGLSIIEQVPVSVPPTDENRDYLETKASRLGHTLDLETGA
jgi:3,4-dihydroxy 2-butanone 4-phosphate synthase/GTP cyclohydrolase II